MRIRRVVCGVATVLTLSNGAAAFYLPGVAPSTYAPGDRVPLTVNALTPAISSIDQQLHAVVSFNYYNPDFHFCQPEGGPKDVRESLGSILFGDRIQTSPFEIVAGQDSRCRSLCPSETFSEREAEFVGNKIAWAYNVNLLVDGLPAGLPDENPLTGEVYGVPGEANATPGFPLGEIADFGEAVLNNHWNIEIDYHKAGLTNTKYRVVGVTVTPQSLAGSIWHENGQGECPGDQGPLYLYNGTSVTYTYSVHWRESNVAWATRWDRYLHVMDPSIHWFMLTAGTVFVILLILMVSVVLARALRKDIARYNRLDNIRLDDLSGNATNDDDLLEDSGWKLVHGDVFRAPRYALLLSVLLGSGAHLFVVTGLTVAFALLGFLSPSNRGFLTTVGLLLYTLLGCVGGYVSARCYKTYGGERWKLNIALTPVLVPGIVFGTFFLMNLFVWFRRASGAVPLTTMLAIIGIWFFISVPSSVAGSWFGFKQRVPETPTRVNQIPRQIPPSPASLRMWPSIAMTGIVPFLSIYVELNPILKSLWTSKIYYMFGFLFVSYGIMIVTTACSTILLVYFVLCAEDYRWQWRAFLGAGVTGVYVFLVEMWFGATRISFGGITGAVLYVGYSALISFVVAILCGSVGFVASYWLLFRIYGSIKID